MQARLGFCFCVFSCYSIVLLNVLQCADTGDVGMGSGGGGRKVWIWGRQNLQNFSPVDWSNALPSLLHGQDGTQLGLPNVI